MEKIDSGRLTPLAEAEIEITAEMINAGVIALFASDRRVDSPEEIISKIYREMTKVKE